MERLKIIREEHNMNQSECAKIVNIVRSTFSSYETGRDTMPINHLVNLCDYFNISIDFVLGLTDERCYKNAKKGINKELIKIRLKELRTNNQLTQKEIAEVLNITRSTWTGYEYGKYRIPTLMLLELAKKYNYSIDYILGKTDKNKS